MYVHIVARTLMGTPVFSDPAFADDLWASMRRGAPDAVAACLMPDHLHQIVAARDHVAVRLGLAKRLGAFARQHGYAQLWDHVPDVQPIADAKHLMRQVRYIHLNPCRAGLVADPLCWRYSTHRDAIGASLDPWVAPARLARCLQYRGSDFPRWFHKYVSSDPCVHVSGTPSPVPAPASPVARLPLDQVIRAALATTRNARTQRRLAVLLAHDQGWRMATEIARALDITPDAVRRLARKPDAELLRIGRLYLADPRLRA